MGSFKDETAGVPIKQFIGIRSKMYSIQLSNKKETRTAKGICKSTIKNDLRHDMYKQCILEATCKMCTMNVIRSIDHTLHTVRKNKQE